MMTSMMPKMPGIGGMGMPKMAPLGGSPGLGGGMMKTMTGSTQPFTAGAMPFAPQMGGLKGYRNQMGMQGAGFGKGMLNKLMTGGYQGGALGAGGMGLNQRQQNRFSRWQQGMPQGVPQPVASTQPAVRPPPVQPTPYGGQPGNEVPWSGYGWNPNIHYGPTDIPISWADGTPFAPRPFSEGLDPTGIRERILLARGSPSAGAPF